MPALILQPGAGVITECQIRDFIGGGARIQVEAAIDLPSVFWLKLTGDGSLRYCTPKWRNKHEVGVESTRDKLLRKARMEISRLDGQMSFAHSCRKPS